VLLGDPVDRRTDSAATALFMPSASRSAITTCAPASARIDENA
jgi:hypothetical protein